MEGRRWQGWRRPRTLVVVAVVLILIGGGAYVLQRLASGGRVTELDIDAVVADFREDVATASAPPTSAPPTSTTPIAPASTAPASTAPSSTAPPSTTSTVPEAVPTLPAPGVYSYATTGYDQVDVLTGARHDYPELTTMTVIPHGCGVRLRWDVAVERWDSWDWCLEGRAIRLVAATTHHEFFGVAGVNEYHCAGAPRPLDAEPGTEWTTVCRVEDRDTSTMRATVLGRVTVTVEGEAVPALHVRYDVELAGVSTGTQTIEGWYRTADGLPLREIFAVNTVQDSPIGAAAFEERSSITLLSLTPRT
jgi:hypothetical protein